MNGISIKFNLFEIMFEPSLLVPLMKSLQVQLNHSKFSFIINYHAVNHKSQNFMDSLLHSLKRLRGNGKFVFLIKYLTQITEWPTMYTDGKRFQNEGDKTQKFTQKLITLLKYKAQEYFFIMIQTKN